MYMKFSMFSFLLILSLFLSCDNSLLLEIPRLLTTQEPLAYPSAGIYENDLREIQLICPTDGAVIYYTTDTSRPNLDSPVYEAPLSLVGHNQELYIRAIALKDGKDISTEFTGAFFVEYSGPEAPEISLKEGGSISNLDGIYNRDLSLTIEAPATDSINLHSTNWNPEDLRYCYTLDGSVPIIDTDSTSPTAGLPILPSGEQNSHFSGIYNISGYIGHNDFLEISSRGYSGSLTGEADSVVLTIRSYVVLPNAYPMSEPRSYTFRVVYQDAIDATVSFDDLAGNRNAPFELHLSINGFYPPGAIIEYKITGISNGDHFGTEYDIYNPLSPPIIFGTDLWPALSSLDKAIVTARIVCPEFQDGLAQSENFTYYLGRPRMPSFQAEAAGQVYNSGDTIPAEHLSAFRVFLGSDSDCKIFYTLDGQEPSLSSILYREELAFQPMGGEDSMVIHCIANRGGVGGVNSPIQTIWFRRD